MALPPEVALLLTPLVAMYGHLPALWLRRPWWEVRALVAAEFAVLTALAVHEVAVDALAVGGLAVLLSFSRRPLPARLCWVLAQLVASVGWGVYGRGDLAVVGMVWNAVGAGLATVLLARARNDSVSPWDRPPDAGLAAELERWHHQGWLLVSFLFAFGAAASG